MFGNYLPRFFQNFLPEKILLIIILSWIISQTLLSYITLLPTYRPSTAYCKLCWIRCYGSIKSLLFTSKCSHLCCSFAKSCLTLCDPMDRRTPGFPVLHHLLEFAQTHLLSRWCHPTISSSVIPFSPCLRSFLASGPFLTSWLFTSGGQNILASAPDLPMNIQDWFPLGLTGFISLQKGILKSLLQHHSLKASILWCSTL